MVNLRLTSNNCEHKGHHAYASAVVMALTVSPPQKGLPGIQGPFWGWQGVGVPPVSVQDEYDELAGLQVAFHRASCSTCSFISLFSSAADPSYNAETSGPPTPPSSPLSVNQSFKLANLPRVVGLSAVAFISCTFSLLLRFLFAEWILVSFSFSDRTNRYSWEFPNRTDGSARPQSGSVTRAYGYAYLGRVETHPSPAFPHVSPRPPFPRALSLARRARPGEFHALRCW